MVDLVGTCPMNEWDEWLSEGDCADDLPDHQEYGWYTAHHLVGKIHAGDRFYVVAHGKLRGWAPVTRVKAERNGISARWSGVILREGGAVACTLLAPVPGFRGLRERWWDRNDEIPFPDWRTP